MTVQLPIYIGNTVLTLERENYNAPTITSTPTTTATVSEEWTYQVVATTANVYDTLTYSLPTKPTGMTINASTGALSWTPNGGHVGNNSVVVLVTNRYGLTIEQDFTVVIPGGASSVVIQYGFEDWSGNANTTPGYVFSSSAESYWNMHVDSTQVISDGDRAYSGTHYLHRQFNTTETDPLLGGVATSINDHGNIGLGGAYPSGYGDKTQLSAAITSSTVTCRFRFATTGEWKNQTSVTGHCKFFRLYGTGGTTDDSSAIVHVSRSDPDDTVFYIYDPSIISYGTQFHADVDLQDGSWHSFAAQVTRNNDANEAGNVTVRVWWDDWAMSGDPIAERTITCPDFGDGFQYWQIAQNWSATYPTSLMGIDIDDIEVWDGVVS